MGVILEMCTINDLTRRQFIHLCASTCALSLAVDKNPAIALPVSLTTSLQQKYEKAMVKAISPDGRILCLEDWGEAGYPLHVVDIDSRLTLYKGSFNGRIAFASFFPDRDALYVTVLGATEKVFGWIVELADGQRVEYKQPERPMVGGTQHISALSTRRLLAFQYTSQPYLTQIVELIELPDYRELAKVPYATEPREPRRKNAGLLLSNDYGYGVSADTGILAYSFDHMLLARRTSDLQLLWIRKTGLRLYAQRVVVSAHGDRIASALSDNAFAELQKEYCVVIYDGKTGEELTRLPISGTAGVALSPDGKLVAIVEPVYSKKSISLTVHFHEVSTGNRLLTILHDVIKRGHLELLRTGCTVRFTSDGKYLITSGMVTNIWKLGE